MSNSYQLGPKIKLSAAVFPWTIEALDRLRRERRLRSRSEAVAEALAEWASERRKESLVSEAVARYGSRYAKAAAREQASAERLLPISLKHRGTP